MDAHLLINIFFRHNATEAKIELVHLLLRFRFRWPSLIPFKFVLKMTERSDILDFDLNIAPMFIVIKSSWYVTIHLPTLSFYFMN